MRISKISVFQWFWSMGSLLIYFCYMRTKYYIEIDGVKTEVPKGCLKNWDEIKCVYKRSDFSGVTRSFTTQFEFVGEMYERLMALYLRDGVNAKAALTLCAITNNWIWEEQFSCELDFSSITWDNYIVKINCIDDSLAALIKARKSTKYEFIVGQDIPVAETLYYDRLVMPNSVSHAIMSNGDDSDGKHKDGSVVINGSSNLKRLPTYVVGDAETYENSPVLFADETDDSGSYFLKLEKSTTNLKVDIEINYFESACPLGAYVKNAEIQLVRFDASNPDINSNYSNLGTVFKLTETKFAAKNRTCVGVFPSLAALKKAYPNPSQDVYAIIGKSNLYRDCESVYFTPVTHNVETEWLPGYKTYTGNRGSEVAYCHEHRFLSRFDLSAQATGSMFALVYKCQMGWDNWYNPRSELHFAIKSKIVTRWDSRAKTISIDALRPQDVLNALMNKLTENKSGITCDISTVDERVAKTYLFAAESVRNIPGAKFYTSFNDFCDWMETVFGYTYYLGTQKEQTQDDLQIIHFVPRTEIFAGDKVVKLSDIRDLNYIVNASLAYSSLRVGYEKQEYEAECGRDEWNFSAQYTTCVDKVDKKLSLISKYRADCYGFEFLAQERSKDTTDNKSDNTVFFIHCKLEEEEQTDTSSNSRSDSETEMTIVTRRLLCDRTATITGALSDTVFNGEYAPYRCAKANGAYIAAALCPITLKFASFDGNTDVTIDGINGNADIQLSEQLFTLGEVEFSSPEVDTELDVNALYEVQSSGITYRGFLKEVSFKYAKAETVKYKLIVKEVEL